MIGVCEYKHLEGDRLSQMQIDNWTATGWTLLEHWARNIGALDVHSYIFKRMKREN